MSVNLTDALRDEYRQLFDTCQVRTANAAEVESTTSKIAAAQPRYQSVGDSLAIPWYFVGIIHCMEGSLRFTTHLHNGDPLTARTRQVPRGRPLTGQPPFTWEESARDALTMMKLHGRDDWSLPTLLYRLEGYNGWGYRKHHPDVKSPYLWSYSNHYTSGKYVADGTWSSTAKSKQVGGAVLLRRMVERGIVRLALDGTPVIGGGSSGTVEAAAPLVRFSKTRRSDAALLLQRALNGFPGIALKEDGVAGERTSDAVKLVVGCYLTGDPRA